MIENRALMETIKKEQEETRIEFESFKLRMKDLKAELSQSMAGFRKEMQDKHEARMKICAKLRADIEELEASLNEL